jgi:hypothetical protein
MSEPPDSDDTVLTDDELVMLHRIDERTENIDQRVDTVVDRTKKNRSRIQATSNDLEEVDNRSRKNRTILTAMTGGIGLLSTWFVDKIGKLL